MAQVSHLVAKFVAFWITFVIAKLIVVAQATSDLGIIRALLGESLTVGVVMIFAYYLMKELKKSHEYNQQRDERLEKIMERDIEFRERQVQAFREQTESFRRLHESISDLKQQIKDK